MPLLLAEAAGGGGAVLVGDRGRGRGGGPDLAVAALDADRAAGRDRRAVLVRHRLGRGRSDAALADLERVRRLGRRLAALLVLPSLSLVVCDEVTPSSETLVLSSLELRPLPFLPIVSVWVVAVVVTPSRPIVRLRIVCLDRRLAVLEGRRRGGDVLFARQLQFLLMQVDLDMRHQVGIRVLPHQDSGEVERLGFEIGDRLQVGLHLVHRAVRHVDLLVGRAFLAASSLARVGSFLPSALSLSERAPSAGLRASNQAS